tara:strand:- start:386 stop:862 length:477 start_codon:yes stop_codon:yes gene_type:complete
MGQTPKPDNKPKYNQNKPYEWVDSQWEKFMEEQKELKNKIEELERENEGLRNIINAKDNQLELDFTGDSPPSADEMLQANLFPTAKEERTDEWRIQQFNRNRGPEEQVKTIEEMEKRIEEMYDSDNLMESPDLYLYESPDGGDTIYRRKSGSSEREKL